MAYVLAADKMIAPLSAREDLNAITLYAVGSGNVKEGVSRSVIRERIGLAELKKRKRRIAQPQQLAKMGIKIKDG